MKNLLLIALFLSGLNAFSQTEDQQLYETGLSKIENEDYQGAIHDFSKVIETDPQNINAYYNRGRAKSLMNKYNEAIIDFDHVLEIKPESTNTLRQRGAANYATQNFKEAITDYSKILEINPNIEASNWIYNYRGLAYSALQEHVKAVTDFKKAFDEVFTSDDMAFKEAWPDLEQMIIISESFKMAGAIEKLDSTIPIIDKWSGKGPSFGNAIIEFKNDGSFYYSYVGKKSYEIVYAAHNSFIIILDSATVPFGHLVVKVLDKNTIEIKEFWSNMSNLQMTIQFGKFKESKFSSGSKKIIDEAMGLLGLEAQDNYSFRGQEISEKTNFAMRTDGHYYINEDNWDRTTEQFEIVKMVDSLKAIGQLKKINDGALKAATYLSKIDPFEGYIPFSLILLEHKRYNDAAFLFYVGLSREAYYESINPNAFRYKYGSRYEEYQADWRDFNAPINAFLEADMENYQFVLQSAYDYLDQNDYPPEPKEDNLEKFSLHLQELQEQINYLSESYTEFYREEPQEIEILAPTIKSSIIGQWTGPSTREYGASPETITLVSFDEKDNCIFPIGDNYIFENLLQIDYGLYEKLKEQKIFRTSYKINYDKNPIQITVELNMPDAKEVISLTYIAKFLEKDVLKLGAPYLNNLAKFRPERTHILTREGTGSKNYFDYKSKFTVSANQKSSEMSDKELELFWKAYILPIIKKDIPTISENTLFPLNQYGNYVDSTSFIRESGFSGVQWDRTSTVLQDVSYKFLDQVILESGEPALMLYVLGKPIYDNYSDSPSYPSFGFLFVKSTGEWKLNNFDFSSSSGELESIENGRIQLLQNGSRDIKQRLFLLETKSFIQECIEPIISNSQDEIIKTIQFPLEGNWGNALGYINSSSEWERSDFSDNLGIFFNEDTGKKLKQEFSYPRYDEIETNENGDHLKTREVRINEGSVTIEEEEYESSFIFKYSKIDTYWKLTKLDWVGRSKADINEARQERSGQLSSEEFDFFMKTNLEPIINFDKKKIIDQTSFPFGYNEQHLSEKEFKGQVANIFSQKLRDCLKNAETRYIRIEHEPRDERILNGIIKRDPPSRTVLQVYLRSPDFQAVIIFEEINGKRVLLGVMEEH